MQTDRQTDRRAAYGDSAQHILLNEHTSRPMHTYYRPCVSPVNRKHARKPDEIRQISLQNLLSIESQTQLSCHDSPNRRAYTYV